MAVGSIGLFHPGEMGAAIGATLVEAGQVVLWASSERGPASASRAAASGLIDGGSPRAVAERCGFVLSICPPAAALEVARQVSGFAGVYVDANAIAPSTARLIAAEIEAGGGRYVDAGIIGLPPTPVRSTHLYLSGPEASEVADLFAGTRVEARVLSADRTAASALKMCYAAWTKGTSALLLAIRAVALADGVEAALLEEWRASLPDLEDASLRAARQAATKGWRWVGEMREIAGTFRAAGLPGGFHEAAAELFALPRRNEEAKADEDTLRAVLEALVGSSGEEAGQQSAPRGML